MSVSEATLHIGQPIQLKTKYAEFQASYISWGGNEGVAVFRGLPFPEPCPVRIHSSCLFSEALGSNDCDCASQLSEALRIIAESGGLLVYTYEEGRGAGLRTKMEAIKLQRDEGVDTASAYHRLGLSRDLRDWQFQSMVLRQLLPPNHPVVLLTNHPGKVDSLRNFGVNVIERRSLVIAQNPEVTRYLEEKSQVLGHLINQ